MENNREKLLDALHKLPEIQPGNELWVKLESSLNTTAENKLFSNLRKIEPPAIIWENIDEKLAIREHRFKIRILVRWSVAAAAVLVLGLFVFTFTGKDHNRLSYSEESLTGQDLHHWHDDDAVIDQALVQICDSKPAACQTLEFKKKEQELDFLDQSKQAIEEQLSQYDSNTELEILLAKVELERTDIIDQMIAIVN